MNLDNELKEYLGWAYEIGKKDGTGLPEVKKELKEFITADRKRVAIEAELKVWMRLKTGDGLSTHDGCFELHPDYINEQIAELKAQQEEV